ncbi:hypothetical protein PGB90_003356 [Kerria lacca]
MEITTEISDQESFDLNCSVSPSENGRRNSCSKSCNASFRSKKLLVAEENRNPNSEISSTEISPDLLFKHPLEHCWSLWYYENNKDKSWEENQKEVTSFSSVEDFWCLYNFIKPASQVRTGCDYSIFKKGIRPMWEDKMNEKGGRWIIKFEYKSRDTEINKYWLDVILLMIGGQFDEFSDEVCGAILNIRNRCDKISIWTPNINRKNEILGIGRKLKDCLSYVNNINLNYESHESAEKKTSKNRYLYSL